MNPDRSAQARHWLDQAQTLLDAGLPDDALTAVRQSMELTGLCEASMLLEAQIHLARCQPRRTLTILDALEKQFAQAAINPHVQLLRAQATIHTDTEQAADLLSELSDIYRDDVRIHRLGAGLALRMNEPQTAASYLWHVVRLEPYNETARRTLACLLENNDPQAAIGLLETQLHTDSLDPQALLTTARLCHEAQRDCDAELNYRRLLQQSPEDVTVLLEAGKLADSKGEDDLAMLRLERAATLNASPSGDVLKSLAYAHMHAGRLVQAGRTWWRAVQIDRADSVAWAGLIICAIACQKPKLARKALRKLTLCSSTPERRETLAHMWLHAAGALAGQGGTSTAHAPVLDDLLHQSHDVFAQQIDEYPQRADMHYHLAICKQAMNDPASAQQSTQAAIAINTTYEAAQQLHQQLEEQLQTTRLAA